MKLFFCFFMVITIIGLGVNMWRLYFQQREMNEELRSLYKVVDPLRLESKQILDDIRYYQHSDNLVKELRQQYNYIYPHEELIIVIPPRE